VRAHWRAGSILLLLLAGAPALAAGPGAAASQAPRQAAAATGAQAGAQAPDDDWLFDAPPGEAPQLSDPLEPANRVIFQGNEGLYRYLLDPISTAYRFVMPDPALRAVRRFFANLHEPSIFLNDLLCLKPGRAGRTGARFLLNSTLGLAGLFDPAGAWGIPPHQSDFGVTLGVYGVGSGPYLVAPLLGPSSTRDLVGNLVDGLLRPDTWLLGAGSQFVLATGGGLSSYELHSRQLDELRKSSVDFYATLRSAYTMDRASRVKELRSDGGDPTPGAASAAAFR